MLKFLYFRIEISRLILALKNSVIRTEIKIVDRRIRNIINQVWIKSIQRLLKERKKNIQNE